MQHKLIKFYSTRSYLKRGEIVKELFERFSPFPHLFGTGCGVTTSSTFMSPSLEWIGSWLWTASSFHKNKKACYYYGGSSELCSPDSYLFNLPTYYLLQTVTPTIGYEIPSSKSHQFWGSIFTKKPPWRQERDYYACRNKNQHENIRRTEARKV